MAARKAARGRRGRSRRRRARRSRGQRSLLRRLIWGAALAAGIAAGLYTAHLDRIVRQRFEGTRFRVPSRVYAAPAVLYPGLDWKRAELRGTLERLGYRPGPSGSALPPGRFHWSDAALRIHRRAFAHPTRSEPGMEIVLELRGDVIRAMRDGSGHGIRYALLEPERVGSYFGADREQRELVELAELPPHLPAAVLSVEDRRFFSHLGVDLWRILGALWVNVSEGRVVQGGSTLTQQLVKNFFLTPERSVGRKLQEAWMALVVEARYEKPAILEAYLNEIYLGQRGATAVHGVGEASRHYFGKPAHEVTVSEAALLAAIINSPNARSPHRHPEEARERRDLVLELMYQQGRLDGETLSRAKAEPLGVGSVTRDPREARWFLDFLRRQLPEFYDHETLTRDGLLIYSSLDLRLQRLAARALGEGLEQLERDFPHLAKGEGPLEGCVLALEPQSGEILALVGGRDYGRSQFDRCTQARRQVGSAFKPFVYAAALEPLAHGPTLTLASSLDDSPLTVSTPQGSWKPENYDHEFHGTVSVPEAMERSFNVATARLGQEVGPERIAEVAARLGIVSALPEVPSLALGAADLAPLEVAHAYATLANGGFRPALRSFQDVVDAGGEQVEEKAVDSERVLDPGTAFLVTTLLEGVVDRGTGHGVRRAGIRGPVAGKTGTTNDARDAWFAGFTPELAIVVWVGFDDPRGMGIPASRAALPIWARFLRDATGGRVAGRFVPPREVVRVDVDPVSGARALSGCPQHEPVWFVRGTEPEEVCPSYRIARPDRDDRDRRARRPAGPTWLERLLDRWVGPR